MHNGRDFLYAGSAAQRGAISGIRFGHAFEKHGDDLPGVDARDFAAAAMRDLNTADKIYEIEQSGGKAILFGNTTSGMAGWINANQPDKSTYFAPEDGVQAYIEGTVDSQGGREISTLERDEINRGTPPDHASNFHVGPESGLRDVSMEQTEALPEAAFDAPEVAPEISTEVAPERSNELSDPEAGSADGGPER